AERAFTSRPARGATSHREIRRLSVHLKAALTNLDLAARLERARERHLVRVLELAADRHAGRDAGRAHSERFDELGQIKRGRLTLDVGAGGQDDLGGRGWAFQAAQELRDAQVVGTHAVERGEHAAQHMIAPAITRALDGEEVGWLRHHADRARVAARVRTRGAGVLLGQVAAYRAQPDLVLDVEDGLRQLARIGRLRAHEVECEPLRSLLADPGQAREQARARLGANENGRGGGGRPRVALAISARANSCALRSAALHAATTRSCSMPTSLRSIACGSIVMRTISRAPDATAVTIPP